MSRETAKLHFERFAGSQTMWWSIVRPNARPARCGRRSVVGSPRSGWNCIPTRRGSSTARMECGAWSTSRCRSRSVGTRSVPGRTYDKKRKQNFTRFLPAVAPEKLTDVSRKAVSWRLQRRTTLTLDDLAEEVNPVLRGWLTYFTAFYPSAVTLIGRRMDRHLMRWARRKYKRLERSEKRTRAWLRGVRQRSPDLFAHWALRYTT